tara:strand:+ start:3402 stop:5867 length:2466 start_codon:yes stop_codon:yes gene_type:complete
MEKYTTYDFKKVENTAQQFWSDSKLFEASESSDKEKFYTLCMFPYPSGNIHMGHVRNYSIGDAIARYQMLRGKNVLQPMGWDAFGLPAENAAIKNKIHPAKWTYKNIENMRSQLQSLGYGYDWSRELATCDPSYYKWEQWLFLKFYEKGLAYKKNSMVNWDPVDNTVLANEQVINGRGWRSGALVEQKEISQWFLKISDYADELLKDLDQLTGWPDQVKTMQKNWIGRSEGLNIVFQVAEYNMDLNVYTTRPDTLMGVTYLAIAPEHPIAQKLADTNESVKEFITSCQLVGKVSEANLATQEKRGLVTDVMATHPVTQEHLPICIANFVLMDYGSGAVMSVPAHDQRDWEFASKMQLPVKQVIEPTNGEECDISKAAFVHKGKLINSGQFTGLDFDSSFKKILDYLSDRSLGKKEVHFRLRDWGVSRQRYWGTPIPMIYCPHCGAVPVPEEDLPVTLPTDFEFDGRSDVLKSLEDFYHVKCPKCNADATRETDTFDTFVESSWYYLRYTCPDQSQKMLDERANYWTPIDLYIGGIEHAIMHLLYMRFIYKGLRDIGMVNQDEPCQKLFTQGMVLKDGAKMSKSKGNVVDPQPYIEKYGADAIRLFMMFAAPPEQDLEWSDAGVEAAHKFLIKLWKVTHQQIDNGNIAVGVVSGDLTSAQRSLRLKLHETIAKVTNNYDQRYTFNTIISSVMELINEFVKFDVITEQDKIIATETLRNVIIMLAPIVPHITHELWQAMGNKEGLLHTDWPTVDQNALVKTSMELAVQVNGKLRSSVNVPADITEQALKEHIFGLDKVKQHIADKQVRRFIVVPKRLVNIVTG